MINNKLILGVILAGGKGSRLDGKGKYSQLLCRRTLLEHVYTRVAAQTSQIAVNFKNKNFCIDISGGLETEGIKDINKIDKFLNSVHNIFS